MDSSTIDGRLVDPVRPGRPGVRGKRAGGVPAGSTLPASGVGSSASLGTIARFASASVSSGLASRVRRFMVQAGSRDLMPDERVAVCLRRRIPGVDRVSVLYSPAQKSAHYGGLIVCGSVWMCPVCAAKISERRRLELEEATGAWTGRLVLATFTLQHRSSDPLLALLDDLQGAVRKMRSGRAWMAFQERYGVAGTIRALEVTHGVNGFHPHQHVLFFVAAGIDVAQFREELRARWGASVAAVGRYASPRWGLDVQDSTAKIADYVAKWGKEPKWTTARELAKSVSKRGRLDGLSMLELLEAYVVLGDRSSGALWREYATVFKGRKQLVWSKGLRALLGLAGVEKSDAEIVEEAVEDAIVLAQLDLSAWRIVLANDARAELLEVADSGDPDRVRAFLQLLGIDLGVRDANLSP
jgi:hypothetical protein